MKQRLKNSIQNSNKQSTSKLNNAISADLDPNLSRVMLPWLLRHPRYLRGGFRLMRTVKSAKKVRVKAMENGLQVPPFMILSITSRCNLHCAGCFAVAAGNINNCKPGSAIQNIPTLTKEQWGNIIAEASELGVMGFVIAGGEPFLFPGLLELCKEFNDRFFLILTNGTAISPEHFKLLKRSTNTAVLVSIEGNLAQTNARRGQGVYEKAIETTKRLSKLGVPNGISVTITRLNYQYWMDPRNIDNLIKTGIRLGAFLEYIPTSPNYNPNHSIQSQSDSNLMLFSEERERFREFIIQTRQTKPIYLIHSPGDEEFFGGCVSAGRGFAHVTPTGELTPCPVSNIATHNLTKTTLKAGLASRLFQEIRNSERLLETEGMPCALFAHPNEVDELAKAVGAYRTDIKIE